MCVTYDVQSISHNIRIAVIYGESVLQTKEILRFSH